MLSFKTDVAGRIMAHKVRAALFVLFAAFTFCYVFLLQADMLLYVAHVLSHGSFSGHRVLLSFTVSLVAVALYFPARKVLPLPEKCHALAYIPSALFLYIVTGVLPDVTPGACAIAVVWLIAAAVLPLLLRRKARPHGGDKDSLPFFISNALILCALLAVTGLLGNANDVQHYELKMERLLNAHKYDAALRVGEKSLATSQRLTCLRTYALSCEGELGEKFFELPQYSSADALIPDAGDGERMIFNPDRIFEHIGAFPAVGESASHFFKRLSTERKLLSAYPAARDYLLMSLLMQKDLDYFAREVKRFYNFSDSLVSVPKHYREALVLYAHLRTTPVVVYKDNLTESNYNDFSDFCDKCKHPVIRANAVRRQYGDTYWWYYYYSK